jgi:mRNA-degrading endonuclease RelE of RelBE toxin-antitoxin system
MPTPDRRLTQMPRFERTKRKLPPKAQLATDEEVKGILADPLSGEPKHGPLVGMRVVKFKVGAQQLLLAYKFDVKTNTVEVWAVGPHENFYRDLKDYMDAR